MKDNKIIIETEKLILRELTENDFDALYAILGDPELMQYYPNVFDEKKIRAWINNNIERYQIFSFGLWAVVLKETGELIGDCGLTMQLIGGKIKPEIGYLIRKNSQKKGYGSEASKAVRDWAFKYTPFNILYSYMKYTNVGSFRTAISTGMKLVDEFPDEVNEFTKVYAITREEWIGFKK